MWCSGADEAAVAWAPRLHQCTLARATSEIWRTAHALAGSPPIQQHPTEPGTLPDLSILSFCKECSFKHSLPWWYLWQRLEIGMYVQAAAALVHMPVQGGSQGAPALEQRFGMHAGPSQPLPRAPSPVPFEFGEPPALALQFLSLTHGPLRSMRCSLLRGGQCSQLKLFPPSSAAYWM